MSDPRPAPDSEVAGESEYGNDTGFATEAASTPDSGSESGRTGTGGSGGDSEWTSPTSEAAPEEPTD